MIATGLKVSELIEKLKALEEEHGDRHVFLSGNDYPSCCDGAEYIREGDSYIPAGSFLLY